MLKDENIEFIEEQFKENWACFFLLKSVKKKYIDNISPLGGLGGDRRLMSVKKKYIDNISPLGGLGGDRRLMSVNKSQILGMYVSEISPMEFYRDMFPIGSFEVEGVLEKKANGLLLKIENGKGKHTLVFDDLKSIEEHLDDECVIISPVAYFGRRRTANNASLLYGICFDLDDVGEEELIWILDRLNNPHFPRATYIANSGGGLHLYYLFKEPIPLYKSIHKKLNDLKHDLTDLIWNKYTSKINPKEKQYQGIFQGFRMVGSNAKNGKEKIKVFKTGEKVDINYLNNYVAKEFIIKSLEYESSLTLEEAKEKYPKWYEKVIVDGEKQKGRWKVKRDLYDWWLRKIKKDKKLSVGHRYYCIAVLASYAVKCSFYDKNKNPNPVTEEELRKDAYCLLDFMNTLKNDFTIDDIESALNFYQESFITFPRNEVERISGLDVPLNKRNYRKQEQHLKIARATRDIIHDNWRDGNGRPKGSKNKNNKKEKMVNEFLEKHKNENLSVTEIAKKLKVSRPTIYKYLK